MPGNQVYCWCTHCEQTARRAGKWPRVKINTKHHHSRSYLPSTLSMKQRIELTGINGSLHTSSFESAPELELETAEIVDELLTELGKWSLCRSYVT